MQLSVEEGVGQQQMHNMFYNSHLDPIVRPFTINTPSLQNIYGTHMQGANA